LIGHPGEQPSRPWGGGGPCWKPASGGERTKKRRSGEGLSRGRPSLDLGSAQDQKHGEALSGLSVAGVVVGFVRRLALKRVLASLLHRDETTPCVCSGCEGGVSF
jgi:hypothetical protein